MRMTPDSFQKGRSLKVLIREVEVHQSKCSTALRLINRRRWFVLTAVVLACDGRKTSAVAAADDAFSGESPACFRDDGLLRFAVTMETGNRPILFLAEPAARFGESPLVKRTWSPSHARRASRSRSRPRRRSTAFSRRASPPTTCEPQWVNMACRT